MARGPNLSFSQSGSGDLIADRRFAYAEGALVDEDWPTARDLYVQTLELVPSWPPAQFGLARALLGLELRDDAINLFQAVAASDTDDRLGARAWLARLGAAGGAMATGYVAALFDEYAPRFEQHLTQSLAYCAPTLIADALVEVAGHRIFREGLDLGCGTGLMAEAIKGRVLRLAGADLSEKMLEIARRSGLYDRLEVGECAAWMAGEAENSTDLVLAADVFCYIEDLLPVFLQAHRVLGDDGLFAFTIQSHSGSGVHVGDDLRVHHSLDFITRISAQAGFCILYQRDVSARQDRGAPVPGGLFVLARRREA
ncbi:COG4976 Predicted methyltransferase (contains TPR repeat) [Rhabdaerophilaceae bacterium]